jgi:hypothetical protein
MCDPTVLAIASTVGGLAATAANYAGESAAASTQEDAYNQWANQQRQNRLKAQQQDEANRQKADAARLQGLQDVSPAAQSATQADEQARLTSYLQGQGPASNSTENPTPVSIADTRLSGQDSGGDTFQSDLMSKLDAASKDSKARIAALATVGSYGGSSGGLDVHNARAFQNAGQGIDLANEFRKGDLSTLGVEQAVNPPQYTYRSPFASLGPTLLSVGSQGLGQTLAQSLRV